MKNLMISLHRFVMGLKRPSRQTNIRSLTKQGETLSTFKIREALGGERLFAKNGEFHGGYCWRDLQKLVDVSSIA
jgi:hypothetical protein